MYIKFLMRIKLYVNFKLIVHYKLRIYSCSDITFVEIVTILIFRFSSYLEFSLNFQNLLLPDLGGGVGREMGSNDPGS